MTAARKDGSVRIKLTISREEHPAMFEALASIRNPRRRTGRLKELVVKALTLEQVGQMARRGDFASADDFMGKHDLPPQALIFLL